MRRALAGGVLTLLLIGAATPGAAVGQTHAPPAPPSSTPDPPPPEPPTTEAPPPTEPPTTTAPPPTEPPTTEAPPPTEPPTTLPPTTTTTLPVGAPTTEPPAFLPEGHANPVVSPEPEPELTRSIGSGTSVWWAVLIFVLSTGAAIAMVATRWWNTRPPPDVETPG